MDLISEYSDCDEMDNEFRQDSLKESDSLISLCAKPSANEATSRIKIKVKPSSIVAADANLSLAELLDSKETLPQFLTVQHLQRVRFPEIRSGLSEKQIATAMIHSNEMSDRSSLLRADSLHHNRSKSPHMGNRTAFAVLGKKQTVVTHQKDTVKDKVKRQRLAGQSGIGSDFKVWKSDEEMRIRQQFDS